MPMYFAYSTKRDMEDALRPCPRPVKGPALVDVVDQWTGRHACALQVALRMTQDEFAELLGVARRTVASWHEKRDTVLRPELQRALDTAHDRAPEHVKLRFVRQLRPGDGHAHQAEVAVELT